MTKLKKYLQEWNKNWAEDLEDFVTGYKEKLDRVDTDIAPWEDTDFKVDVYLDSAERIVDTIANDCWPFIKEMTNIKKFLWRGVNGNIKGIRKLKSHIEDRIPMTSSCVAHDMFNELAREKFGWPIRNGVSCSASETLASTFGDVSGLFFPIGKYEYVWSSKHKDLVLEFDWDFERSMEKYKKILNTYIGRNLPVAIKGRGEILFKCDYYYVVEETYHTALSLAMFGE